MVIQIVSKNIRCSLVTESIAVSEIRESKVESGIMKNNKDSTEIKKTIKDCEVIWNLLITTLSLFYLILFILYFHFSCLFKSHLKTIELQRQSFHICHFMANASNRNAFKYFYFIALLAEHFFVIFKINLTFGVHPLWQLKVCIFVIFEIHPLSGMHSEK